MGDVESFQVVSNSDPSLISRENWEIAERRTHEILCAIQPTVVADQTRREVIDYIRGLITASLGCEVFPYGSVPLKTYLPDGDIDMTVIGTPHIEDTFASAVLAILMGEEHNKYAQYEVKDVHCIDAEVKLVKCLVENTVVDISFNQLGGFCALCFLEEADRLIGQEHLFKRSIILIKAWCYYESRILGAHHGLISTYALETLVLYIFHLFHSSLDGPLSVLYRFLDYFSKFDWENYCVSLNGPVCKSSLPDIVANTSENGRNNVLLSEEFLQNCVDKYSVPLRGIETNLRVFPQKHLNIFDPLKENNNLGRSVNKGNFYRIRYAFKYGARMLGQILLLPRERLVDELNKFFANILERRGTDASYAKQSFSTQHSDICHADSVLLKSIAGDGNDGNDKKIEFRKSENGRRPAEFFTDDMNFARCPEPEENNLVAIISFGSFSNHERMTLNGLAPSTHAPNISENSSCALRERKLAGNLGSGEPLKFFLDLTGDYDDYFSSLIYSRNYYLSAPAVPGPPMAYKLQCKNLWETICESIKSEPNIYYSEMNTSSGLGSQFYSLNSPMPSDSTFGSEEKKKCRGIGTFFPKTNYSLNTNRDRDGDKDRPSIGRGRFQAPRAHGRFGRHTHSNGLTRALTTMSLFAEGNHELSQEEYPILGNGKSASLDFQRPHSGVWGSFNARDFSHQPKRHESRCYNLQPLEVPLLEVSTESSSDTSHSGDSSASSPVPVAPSPEAKHSVEDKSYHLKNEVHFPPLHLKWMDGQNIEDK